MDKISIHGGIVLEGSVKISGSKNASLPLMVLSLLTEEACVLDNVPNLNDVLTMKDLLFSLGVKNKTIDSSLTLNAQNLVSLKADYELVRKMRASLLVLGPLLARCGEAEVSLPGGCAIGSRPIDLHLFALKKMGAEFEIHEGYIKGRVPKGRLIGTEIEFPKQSVGATENIIMAATLAKGTTLLKT